MEARPLTDADRRGIRDLLAADPVVNLHLLAHLDRPGPIQDLFGALGPDGSLQGVALATPSGFSVPWAPDPEAARTLGAFLRDRRAVSFLVGPREACDALWEALASPQPPRRRWDQRLWVCHAPSDGPMPEGFRRARPEEAEAVASRNVAMMLEDLGYDPSIVDPDGHARVIRNRIREGRTWVVEVEGAIRFQIDVGTAGPHGALVGGTWVDPAWRGRGLCAQGMRALAHELLRHHPVVALHLHEDNAPAAGCYRRAGFRPGAAFRILMAG